MTKLSTKKENNIIIGRTLFRLPVTLQLIDLVANQNSNYLTITVPCIVVGCSEQ
jgi:hypothetical protein